MRTVVIVGAGGSLAQASALRPSRRRLHPPLDLTFFEKANELSKSVTSVANRVRRLRRVIEASGLFFDPWAPPSPPMEQFFADVYYEVASNDPDAFPVFVELLHLYAVVLAHTTNWMACRNRPGLIGKLL
jgi:hypothetical protein